MVRTLCSFSICALLTGALRGEDQGLVARWSFASSQGAAARESVSGAEGKIEGFYKYVPGVSGDGLRFDGYTTSLTLPAKNTPAVGSEGLSVEAWVALNTYPWNWVPIVDWDETQQGGYFFGIDAFGHVGLQVAVERVWDSCTSRDTMLLKKWAHITGTYEPTKGFAVHLDGKEVCQLPVTGKVTQPVHKPYLDLLVGRIREAQFPFFWRHPKVKAWYSLDGILDEVSIYNRGL